MTYLVFSRDGLYGKYYSQDVSDEVIFWYWIYGIGKCNPLGYSAHLGNFWCIDEIVYIWSNTTHIMSMN